jgi:hypothetical protein
MTACSSPPLKNFCGSTAPELNPRPHHTGLKPGYFPSSKTSTTMLFISTPASQQASERVLYLPFFRFKQAIDLRDTPFVFIPALSFFSLLLLVYLYTHHSWVPFFFFSFLFLVAKLWLDTLMTDSTCLWFTKFMLRLVVIYGRLFLSLCLFWGERRVKNGGI